ncbi:MAG: hypothetical protein J5848_05090 [Bacteroidales bacterium]|nr:hypothetical protein [Bacteroidales bacterium]
MAQIRCSVCGYTYDSSFAVCPNCGNQQGQNNQQDATIYDKRSNAEPTLPPYSNPAPKNNVSTDDFGMQLGDALIHFIYRIVYFFFILPVALWKKAVERLSKQRRSKALDAAEIKTDWPFLTWMKRFVLEFLIDGLILVAWLLFLLIFMFSIDWEIGDAFEFAAGPTLGMFYVIFFSPVFLTLVRDIIVLGVVLPIRWWISFFNRPAKTYDLTHVGSIKR